MPLTAIEPTWINTVAGVGPAYDAEELRRDLGFLLMGGTSAGLSRTGVLDPRALTVTLSGSNVQINPGGAAVGTAKGCYLTGASATATIDALTPADATNPRRDRVVLEILDPDNGGGAGRLAQFRVITGTPSATATAGGGYPAAPSSPSITLAHVDVPKSGNGNPTVTDLRPFTAAAGGMFRVNTEQERDALTKIPGLAVRRADRGYTVDYTDGATWKAEAKFVIGQGSRQPILQAGDLTATTNANGDLTVIFPEAFPTECKSCVAISTEGTNPLISLQASPAPRSRTQASFRAYNAAGAARNNVPISLTWIAVGS